MTIRPISTIVSVPQPRVARARKRPSRHVATASSAVATGKEARDVYKLDEHYSSAEETLAKIGFPPGRKPGQLGFTFHA